MSENLVKTVGKKFKQLIEEKNITQDNAAKMLGVDERTVRRWIKDGIDRLSTLEKIADKFNIDVIDSFFK